jgi:uncharacterized protein (DUF983 family)
MKLRNAMALRCPVCERGKLFHGYFDAPVRCPECGYFFMRETGYFLPHVAIGYPIIVFVALSTWPILRYGFGVTSDRLILTVMVVTGLVFGVWFLRYAKMLWLLLDLKVHPPAQEDFQSRGRSK